MAPRRWPGRAEGLTVRDEQEEEVVLARAPAQKRPVTDCSRRARPRQSSAPTGPECASKSVQCRILFMA